MMMTEIESGRMAVSNANCQNGSGWVDKLHRFHFGQSIRLLDVFDSM